MTPLPKPQTRGHVKTLQLSIKPLEGIVLGEDCLEGLGLIFVLNLLHMNAMKFCGLGFTRNKRSKHEVAIASPWMLCQSGEKGKWTVGILLLGIGMGGIRVRKEDLSENVNAIC